MSTVMPVHDSSQVGEARRAAMSLGKARGMDEEACGSVGIVVTELANNLIRHAGTGALSLRWLGAPGSGGIEVVAADRGPGMADVDRCLRDGFSTVGTAGTGLGAVRRLSDEFDIHSAPGQGTAIVSRIYVAPRSGTAAGRRLRWAVHCTPAPGETECGDIWRVDLRDGQASVLVADGLGHGPLAATAARSVAASFDKDPAATPTRFLQAAHAEASSTRGAAVAMLQLDLATGAIRYAGVGNIAGSVLLDGVGRGMMSHNGTLGMQLRKIQEFDYQLALGGLLVMHSDGLQSRWSLDAYPGLARRDPALVAAVLARDFRRGHDDLTVLVARLELAR